MGRPIVSKAFPMTPFKTNTMRAALLVSLVCVPVAAPAMALSYDEKGHDAKTEAEVAPTPYKSRDNTMAAVDALLARAEADKKLGLIVLGGNWCHDSQALARNLNSPEVSSVVGDNYETILIDVAGLSENMDVARRFGLPVIYGTPTVLIVDPKTQTLLNPYNTHQMRDADSVSVQDTAAFFTKMSKLDTHSVQTDAALGDHFKAMLADIDTFEKAQADRIYGGFKVIGPIITMDKDKRPENFRELWVELSKFRYQITEDLAALRAKVHAMAEAGDTAGTLTYPTYTPFSWEK